MLMKYTVAYLLNYGQVSIVDPIKGLYKWVDQRSAKEQFSYHMQMLLFRVEAFNKLKDNEAALLLGNKLEYDFYQDAAAASKEPLTPGIELSEEVAQRTRACILEEYTLKTEDSVSGGILFCLPQPCRLTEAALSLRPDMTHHMFLMEGIFYDIPE